MLQEGAYFLDIPVEKGLETCLPKGPWIWHFSGALLTGDQTVCEPHSSVDLETSQQCEGIPQSGW